ncbi:MAG: tRNA (adenosine(37)-N6)-dimethylallyltransferase MiaA [Clostridia bacterium]|nr:tRNA (adenosine(37)-N6)-dimethylallyltransferase MiaA [Clostridia bacterium]
MKPKIIVIAGPTASGKTACAVELCRKIGGEVVSADSMQIYRGMDVLSAKPTAGEMRGVPHHMLGIASPAEKYSAAKYRDMAREVIADILARGKVPMLCGGTGLYINAVTRPMEFSETCDEALRQELIAIGETPGGRRRLHDMLREIDPEAAGKLHENDVRRVTRAIEVYRLTGRTQSEQARLDAGREGDYNETFFALRWPRDVLYARIDRRVDEMIQDGLIEEVRELRKDEQSHPTALQAIGYKEIAAALEGRLAMDEAVRLVKQFSRNYAKKQMTWFQRDPRAVWLDAEGKSAGAITDEMIKYLEEQP